MNRQSKVVLITGCSYGGIGDALAQSFHCQGQKVLATARDLSKVEHLKRRGITVLALDVTSQASISAIAEYIEMHHDNKLDIIVNNAGSGYAAPILDTSLPLARTVFETNLFSRVTLVQALSIAIINAQGTIVNIGSIGAIAPQPWAAMYHACYAAIHQWNDILRLEMKPLGVKVMLIITGAINTKFLGNAIGGKIGEESRYFAGRDAIVKVMSGGVEGGSDPGRYAEKVVRVVMEGKRKRIWVGKFTNRLWFVRAFLWATAWDYILPGPFAINEFEKQLKKKGKVA